MVKFKVNGQSVAFDGDGSTPLLWYLRDNLKLTGTKFGCGIGSCGACTVHLDGKAARSCSLPVSALAGRQINTIESLATDGQLSPVQQAWIEHDVPQCGYCQAGQIMAVTDFLKSNPNPSDADIDTKLSNLCRCGTYTRMRTAIHHAAKLQRKAGGAA
ncbi:MAG: (2Fe-2S)-binding protein [Gammaproteobacteria bacterium]|nr:(2Fe-2S)-binding protein [Gammaproteobacteria bacterium]